jgi:MoxR-like ATPase
MSTSFGSAASPLSPLSPKDAAIPVLTQAKAVPDAPTAAAQPSPDPAPTVKSRIQALLTNIESAIMGKRETVKFTLIGLLARGHVLIEDVPGVGKTTLARALAKSIDCQFRRIQFTPDLLPSDIVGVSVFEQKEGRFKFHHGPLFANIILADEINRTTPRTQSALLEAMNDFQVSVDGVTYPLPGPFMVLATQNPIEYSGTYSLPEAQLDRFLLRVAIGYPDRDSERQVLKGQRISHPLDAMKPVVTAAEVLQLQEVVRQVIVNDALADYILEIAARTREHKGLTLGVSPRGCLMLYRAAQACAVIEGRNYCTPDDIKKLAQPVLGHRIIEKGRDAGASRKDSDAILREILDDVPVPI